LYAALAALLCLFASLFLLQRALFRLALRMQAGEAHPLRIWEKPRPIEARPLSGEEPERPDSGPEESMQPFLCEEPERPALDSKEGRLA